MMAAIAARKAAPSPAPVERAPRKRLERTEGIHALTRLGLTNKQIAEAIEVEPSTVGRWLACETRPTARQRDRIEKKFGIAPAMFDAARKAENAEPLNLEEDREALFLRLLDNRLRALERTCNSADVLPKDVAMFNEVQGMIDRAAKNMSPKEQRRRIFESPEWERVVGVLSRVLAPYPEAAAELVEALRELEKGRA